MLHFFEPRYRIWYEGSWKATVCLAFAAANLEQEQEPQPFEFGQ